MSSAYNNLVFFLKTAMLLLLLIITQSLLAKKTSNNVNKLDEILYYQLDIVVFLNESSMHGSEKWSTIFESLDYLSKASYSNLEVDTFITLPDHAQLLQKEDNMLDKQSNYRVLDRKAWLIPVKEGKSLKSVSIQSYGTKDQLSMLEGTLTVYFSQYIHIDINMWYRELTLVSIVAEMNELINCNSNEISSKDHSNVNQDIQLVTMPNGQKMKIARSFQLKDSRKIHNYNQVQYFDSPVIGILFKFTPYEQPDQLNLLDISTEKNL